MSKMITINILMQKSAVANDIQSGSGFPYPSKGIISKAQAFRSDHGEFATSLKVASENAIEKNTVVSMMDPATEEIIGVFHQLNLRNRSKT